VLKMYLVKSGIEVAEVEESSVSAELELEFACFQYKCSCHFLPKMTFAIIEFAESEEEEAAETAVSVGLEFQYAHSDTWSHPPEKKGFG
jgi:hypothetical protein